MHSECSVFSPGFAQLQEELAQNTTQPVFFGARNARAVRQTVVTTCSSWGDLSEAEVEFAGVAGTSRRCATVQQRRMSSKVVRTTQLDGSLSGRTRGVRR